MNFVSLVTMTAVLAGVEPAIRLSEVAAQPAQPASCPAADGGGTAIVRKLLASDPRAALRWASESARLRHTPVRPLVARTDQDVCSRLDQFLTAAVTEDPLVSRSYHAIGQYYIVVLRRERIVGSRNSEFTPVIILDDDLKPVEILGM
jgi:hypothetical protein